MQYVFVFLLITCLAVGLVTYILSFALFFRKKTALEKFFIAFLTCFTLRMVIDTVIFYVLPHLEPPGFVLYILLLIGRLAVIGCFIFISLFMHTLTGIFQTKKSRLLIYGISLALLLFFTGDHILTYLRQLPDMRVLYAFSPVDFMYYVFLLYPIAVFFICMKRIQDASYKIMIRNFFILILCALPFMLFEDFFGSFTVIFEFASDNPLPLKLFPVYYLMVFLHFLYHGIKNVIREGRAAGVQPMVSDGFIARFKITGREKEIILLMIEGASNKQIGEKLFISTATVRNHLHNIFEKTGVANRVALLRLASS